MRANDGLESAGVETLFGTDGIRDRFGKRMLSTETVERVLAATVRVLSERQKFSDDFPGKNGETILVGRDTRASGSVLLEMVAASFVDAGYRVFDLGVLPTPGVAMVARACEEAALGVVLSASHNPAEYNGIKFLAPTGAKISPAFERAVEREYAAGGAARGVRQGGGELVDKRDDARRDYVDDLVGRCRNPRRLRGRTIFLDTAHGATFEVAPEVFRRLGMIVKSIGDEPDGRNINEGVGALHPDRLSAELEGREACLGLCFDGDGDRMIPVTRSGTVLDGDYVLALAGRHLSRTGGLPNRTIVATVMSNVGLELALRDQGVELLRTDVGDRNVYLEMLQGQHPVGGEQSGHTIFMDDGRTGDGILSGLRLLDMLESDDLDLDLEARIMKRYPQVLKNVRVEEKKPFEELGGVLDVVRAVEDQLAGEGRVVLRYSGTEPLARVMVEGSDRESIERFSDEICDAIRATL